MLTGRKIILGVTGSIAAYKAAVLLRLFVKAGADVTVVTTDGARKFISDLTFSNLSMKPVFGDLWGGSWTEHIHLAEAADLMVIAPASANTLAKLAGGLADNALSAVALAVRCPLLVAPAMDAGMISHAATQHNLSLLRNRGVHIAEPGTGFLASGLEGEGRMAEPEVILQMAADLLGGTPLKGRKVLITAGPTREPIDPVRYLSNHSSGKMGFALAELAARMGAEVTLISGPSSVRPAVPAVQVQTAAEMAEAVFAWASGQDILIMAAAVADYTPANPASEKIKKSGDALSIELVKTTDILAELGRRKQPSQILVGFALETQNEEENARKKLVQKNLDYIILNSLRDGGAGFGHDTNKITILDARGNVHRYPLYTKTETARHILNQICNDQNWS